LWQWQWHFYKEYDKWNSST